MRRWRAPLAIVACVAVAAAYAVPVRGNLGWSFGTITDTGPISRPTYDLDYQVDWGVRNPAAWFTSPDP